MTPNQDQLSQAKRKLPLTELMAQLGYGEQARKSARCPFHDDASASFSIFTGDDGQQRWKCHAGCGTGDAIDFLAKAKTLSNADACREFIALANVAPTATPSMPTRTPSMTQPAPFNWTSCVSALTTDHRAQLAIWRGYSFEFVNWLHEQKLVGLFAGQHIAFPVQDSAGTIIGCHYRLKSDGSWRYHPTGTRTTPVIIGDMAKAVTVYAFESQWDFCAIADKLGWHTGMPAHTAVIITRGAENGKSVAGRCSSAAKVYAFGQNDEPNPRYGIRPGEKWLAAVAAHCGCACFQVATPAPHKDANDWTRAGATAEDIQAAIIAAKPIETAIWPAAVGSDPAEPDLIAFPIDCLPPAMAAITTAVASAMRVPESMPGTMALALVAASIGKGMVLDWRPGKSPTPANLFCLLSAESGTGKSECYKIVAEPYLTYERAMQAHWHKDIKPALSTDLRYAEGQLKRLDRKLAKDSTTAEQAEQFHAEMNTYTKKVEMLKSLLQEPQLCIQDATVEKAATVMHRNEETTFSTSSDARKLVDNLLGRYSGNKGLADDGIYLCAYSGDDVKVDRQGRDSVRLANPCMTLFWALQPDALEMLLNEQSLQQGGFLARCLLAHVQAEPQFIGGETNGIPDTVKVQWAALIRNLIPAYRQPPVSPMVTSEVIETEI